MDRRRLESAAAENSHLRGLYGIPLGALMILSALGNWEWGPLRHAWAFGCCALVLILACLPLARFYDEHYGRATPSPRQQARAVVAVLVCLPVVIGGSTLLSSRASWSLDLPVNPTAISLAIVMLATYALSVGLRSHQVVILGALLLAGVMPVWERAGMSGNAGLALAGVAVMALGALDHRLLVRTFGPPEGMDVGRTDVRA
jgi:hypothetical protein